MHGMAPQRGEIEAVAASLQASPPSADILICLLARLISRAVRTVAGRIAVGAADCSSEIAGAFTGDLSAEVLKDVGASAVIRQRRQHHGATDAIGAAKAKAARRAGLSVIICFGETNSQRLAGNALSACGDQIGLSVSEGMTASGTAIGYAPLWPIGSGHMPTFEQIIKVHAHIRERLAARLGTGGKKVRILYGGSVKPSSAHAILVLPEVGGVLVDGASPKSADFKTMFVAVPAVANHELAGFPIESVPNRSRCKEQP